MKLKYECPGIEDMRLSWSQSAQELFAFTMANGKRDGTFLEIGAAWAIAGNNTYILEKYYGYRGISIDIKDEYQGEWLEERPQANLLIRDATLIDYSVLLENWPAQIEYLQIDLDAPEDSMAALRGILSTGHRFSAITFETDLYVDQHEGGNGGYTHSKNLAREILEDSGYELLIENVGCINGKPEQLTYDQLVPFEDWYIDPRVVDGRISERFKNTGSDLIDPKKIFWDWSA